VELSCTTVMSSPSVSTDNMQQPPEFPPMMVCTAGNGWSSYNDDNIKDTLHHYRIELHIQLGISDAIEEA
jgi:hypothetical protein